MRDRILAACGLLVLGAWFVGCSKDGKSPSDLPPGPEGEISEIRLDPETLSVQLDGISADPIAYTVTSVYENGYEEAVDPTAVTWRLYRPDATPPGQIIDGTYLPNPSAGGEVTVIAWHGSQQALATVSFLLDATVGSPLDPNDWTGTPQLGPGAPLVVYPSDETRFPRNIYRTLFQWRTEGLTEFRLTFTGPASTVTVYTDGAHADCAAANPAAGCWEAGATEWSYLAGSNAGATMSWALDGLDRSTDPPTVRRATPITIGFSSLDVKGAIFYWSTTSKGVRRASVDDPAPVDYITGDPGTAYGADTVKCVACHTVSRDGKYIAAAVDADSGKSMWLLEVTPAAPPTPLVTSVTNTSGHGFATFSPDNDHVVASWDGAMWTVDRATGNYLADIDLQGLEATHPDWAPNGNSLAFATGRGDAPGDASIAVTTVQAGPSFGAPQILVPAANGETNLFPAYSPNSRWLAFSRGTGGHGDDAAQLYLVHESGTPVIELVNANRISSNTLGDGQWENSLPTWAPTGDLEWIAFNSKREYGVVLPAGTQQIWVTAIDLAKAAAGEDASYPAFRLQFQGLAEDNHRAFWTTDISDNEGDL